MTMSESSPEPVAEHDNSPLCESRNCAKKKRGVHVATHEVLLTCDDETYWCDYAIAFSDQHLSRHTPEFVAEELKLTGEYDRVAGVMCETTDGIVPMIDVVAMGLEALRAPYCALCREVALVAIAVPIENRP